MKTLLTPQTLNIIIDYGEQLKLYSPVQKTFSSTNEIIVPENTSLYYIIAWENQSISRVVKLVLSEAQSQAHFYGYIVAGCSNQVNLSTIIDHQAPHTQGFSFIKGILDGNATVSLHGLIQIQKKASDSQDQLTERLLILSQEAVGELKPELEILNHDVKASHATTISHVDDEQMWYLKSRGLPQKKSRALLINGFLNEVTQRISELTLPPEVLSEITNKYKI